MRKAHGAIVVFDVTNKKTFSSVPYWIDTLKEKVANENVQIVLVGNKIDRAQHRLVSVGEGEELARQYGISYCEVTASETSMLNDLFKNVCQSKNYPIQRYRDPRVESIPRWIVQ